MLYMLGMYYQSKSSFGVAVFIFEFTMSNVTNKKISNALTPLQKISKLVRDVKNIFLTKIKTA